MISKAKIFVMNSILIYNVGEWPWPFVEYAQQGEQASSNARLSKRITQPELY